MTTIDEQITALTDKYYRLANRDHHKDRDCHFYIQKTWSYGEPPIYRVMHFGYLHEWRGPEGFESSQDAHEALLQFLKRIVKEEEAVDPDAGWYE